MGQSRPLFRLFLSFPHDTIQIQIDNSIDGVLGTWTQGDKMEGADKSTELWWHPSIPYSFLLNLSVLICLFSLSLFLSLFLSILLPFPLKTIFNCQLEGQSQTSTLSDQLKVSRAGLNIIKRFGPQNISRGSPGLVVKWGDSCSEGRRFESQRCILDGHFSHLFGVKIVMFVWIDENEWKRG